MLLDLDFCVRPQPEAGWMGLDKIFHILGDHTYQVPRKEITPGKTYFVHTASGCGTVHYNGLTFTLQGGDFLFMQPTENFSYGCTQDRWLFWWFECMQPQCHFTPDQLHHTVSNDFLWSLYDQSMVHAKAERWDVSEALFASACRILEQPGLLKTSTRSQRLLLAESYLRENLSSATVEGLCEHLQLSERTVRNLFHSEYDCSPKQRMMKLRLETAQLMLASTTLPLHEISSLLGFSSPFHFSRSFHAHFGLAPKDYRRISFGK